MSNLPEIKVFAGENSQYIAESIASSLGLELGKKTFTRFSDGEFVTSFDETVSANTYLSCNQPSRPVITSWNYS